jgi:hypothetical protein
MAAPAPVTILPAEFENLLVQFRIDYGASVQGDAEAISRCQQILTFDPLLYPHHPSRLSSNNLAKSTRYLGESESFAAVRTRDAMHVASLNMLESFCRHLPTSGLGPLSTTRPSIDSLAAAAPLQACASLLLSHFQTARSRGVGVFPRNIHRHSIMPLNSSGNGGVYDAHVCCGHHRCP